MLGDFVRFASGQLLFLIASAAWTFALPRRLSVEEYANWRLFVIYAGFVGIVHLGGYDAMLYRWSRRRSSSMPASFWPAALVVLLAHGALAMAWLMTALVAQYSTPTIVGGVVIIVYALIWNLASGAQYALQARGRLWTISAFAAVHGLAFLAVVLSGRLDGARGLLVATVYTAAAGLALVVALLPFTSKPTGRLFRHSWRLTRVAIAAGMPILVVNLLLIFLVNADRIAVSLAFPKSEFAHYAFATSLIALANALVTIGGRFIIPTVTTWIRTDRFEREERRMLLLLFAIWGAIDAVAVAGASQFGDWVPRYRASLPIAFVLLTGIAFSAAIQMLQLPFARAAGRAGQSTRSALEATVVAVVALALASRTGSLIAMALTGVAVVIGWWIIGVIRVMPRTIGALKPHAAFLFAVLTVSGVSGALLSRDDARARPLAAALCALAAAGALVWLRKGEAVDAIAMPQ